MKRLLLVLVTVMVISVGFATWAARTNVVFGENEDYATLDPRISQSRHELQLMEHVFDTLVFRDLDGTLYPFLAESWDINVNSTEFTFHLRRDVKFHDGTPFNAEAVKYTFDSAVDPELGSQATVDYLGGENYKGTEVVDEYTAKVMFYEPYSAFPIKCTHAWMSIVSPTAARGRPDEFAEHPVGTGPFMFVEWVRGDYIKLKKNPEYNWAPSPMGHQGPAYLEEIIIKEIQNDTTRVAALEEEEIDVSDYTAPVDLRRLEQSGRFNILVGNTTGVPLALMFNLEDPVSGDIYVRKAANYAIDQASLVQKFAFGYRKPAYGILSPGTAGYWEGVEAFYPYDPELAKTTLELGGWSIGPDGFYYKDGQKCSIFFPIIYRETEMTIVQAELKKVGIDLQVTPVSNQVQNEYIMDGVGNFLMRWTDPDASILRVQLHSSSISEPGLFKFNWCRLDSARVDELLDIAEAQPTIDDRDEIYARIQEFERSLALCLPFSPVSQTLAYAKGLSGVRLDSRQHEILFYDAKWEE